MEGVTGEHKPVHLSNSNRSQWHWSDEDWGASLQSLSHIKATNMREKLTKWDLMELSCWLDGASGIEIDPFLVWWRSIVDCESESKSPRTVKATLTMEWMRLLIALREREKNKDLLQHGENIFDITLSRQQFAIRYTVVSPSGNISSKVNPNGAR